MKKSTTHTIHAIAAAAIAALLCVTCADNNATGGGDADAFNKGIKADGTGGPGVSPPDSGCPSTRPECSGYVDPDPCLANQYLEGCPAYEICLANPTPECPNYVDPDPCLTNQYLEGCPAYETCLANPTPECPNYVDPDPCDADPTAQGCPNYCPSTQVGCPGYFIPYTIAFNANSGTVSTNSGTTGADGKLDSLPIPTREDYTFNGWYTAAEGGDKVTTSTVFERDATIYAQWLTGFVPTYTITFNGNGGAMTSTFGTTDASRTLSSLPTPTRTGYTFNGWYTATEGGDKVTTSTVFTTNATIYAQWTLNHYTIRFHPNGGTVIPDSGMTGEDWTLTTLPTLTRTGYTFNGWYTASSGGSEVTTGTVFTTNTTIYAQWTLNSYTITFNPNGGTVSPIFNSTGENGRLADLPTPTRPDYTFNGWFTEATGGTGVTTSTTFNSDTIIYAQWTLITYTIKFDANGGPINPPPTTTGEGWTLANLPTLAIRDDGYTFDGWFTAATGGTKVTTNTIFSANTTVYAHWTMEDYVVMFDANGGSGTVPIPLVGESITLPSGDDLKRSGYTFRGWGPYAIGDPTYSVDSSYRVYGRVTLYAKWTANPTPAITYFTDSRDGISYKMVTIGSQTWMAENLNYDVPNVTNDGCSYNDCSYGRMYSWSTIMNGSPGSSAIPSGVQGICPVGWHVPSDWEWEILQDNVGGNETAGTKLKSTSGWNNNGNGTDEYGFSALPADPYGTSVL